MGSGLWGVVVIYSSELYIDIVVSPQLLHHYFNLVEARTREPGAPNSLRRDCRTIHEKIGVRTTSPMSVIFEYGETAPEEYCANYHGKEFRTAVR